MSSYEVHEQAPPRSLKRLSLLFVMQLVLAGCGLMLVYIHQSFANDVFEGIETGKALIILHEIITSAIFGIIAFFSGMVVLFVDFFVVDILNRSDSRPKLATRIQKWCVWGMALGIALILFGGLVTNPLWHNQLEKGGYEQCPSSVFLFSESFTKSAWVREKRWCYDEKFADILSNPSSSGNIDKANRYLERTYMSAKSD